MKRFIVIELFDKEFPNIVTTEDGMPKIFDTREEAEVEAEDCQDGVVFEY